MSGGVSNGGTRSSACRCSPSRVKSFTVMADAPVHWCSRLEWLACYGALARNGSLLAFGTLSPNGSLVGVGALSRDGSLYSYGALASCGSHRPPRHGKRS